MLLFGSLAQAAGARDETLELSAQASGAEVVAEVARRHPDAAPILARAQLAVNHEVVPLSERVSETDEIALLPPVSGGSAVTVGLRRRPSAAEALEAVADPGAGGTAVFVGTVRDHSEAGAVDALEYEAYEDMAVRVMADIAEEAMLKWGLAAVAVLHGVGPMAVGDTTIVVACAAAHRAEAFDACRHIVDEVKRRVPVWKRESGPWGQRWVE